MTLPGFSGSFILILLGNYILLLVDSVNALYDTFSEVITGDFSVIQNEVRLRLLKVLSIFTLGSVVGLVSFSHVLSYVLKHYKSITTASIIGFIVGSLGVVWPWKITIFKTEINGNFMLDSRGEKIISNYKRFLPQMETQTYIAMGYILLGIAVVLVLERYGQYTKKII